MKSLAALLIALMIWGLGLLAFTGRVDLSTPAPEPPQAGIPSKAGSGAEKEDFSTLFGTIGLPNLQI